MYIRPIVSLILTMFVHLLYSQDEETIRDLYFEGNQYILSEEHIEALPAFQELYTIMPTANIKYKIGECYLNIEGSEQKAIPYLVDAVKESSSQYDPALPTEKNTPLRSWFLLGRAYRVDNQLDKAVESFTVLIDSLNGDDTEVLDQIYREIEICENARLFIESPIKFKADNLGPEINNANRNYNPVVTDSANTLYYMEALKFYDAIMQAGKSADGWLGADNITMKLKSDGDFYVTGGTKDGSVLFFQYYDIYTNGDIYQSMLEDGKWSKITRLNDHINTPYNETHFSVSPDGKTAYFTSNRPGGYGGLDIYYSRLDENGQWGPAKNVGPVINTFRNETTPFITEDGVLYFSSESHFNMGGYDIFKSEMATDTFGKPKNLGYPVNTTSDNTFWYPYNNGQTGYYSQVSEDGFGNRDIYRFSNLTEPRLRKFEIPGVIKFDIQPLQGVTPVVALFEGDRAKLKEEKATENRFYFRTYAGDYKLIARAEGYRNDTVHVVFKEEQDEWELPVTMQLIKIVEETIVDEQDTIILRTLYYSFDSHKLTQDDKSYVKNLVGQLNEYDSIKVVVHGHTDAMGPEVYNTYLSKLRAENIRDFFIEAGFNAGNITIKAEGESNPLISNTRDDGSDFIRGRKFNRRVEIEIQNVPDGVTIIREHNIPEDLEPYRIQD